VEKGGKAIIFRERINEPFVYELTTRFKKLDSKLDTLLGAKEIN